MLLIVGNILNNENGKISDILPFINMLLEYSLDKFVTDTTVLEMLFNKGLSVAFDPKQGYSEVIDAFLLLQTMIAYLSKFHVIDGQVTLLISKIIEHNRNSSNIIQSIKLRHMTTIFICVG